MASATPRFPWHRYRAPRYWPTRFGFACFWLLSRLPFDWQMAAGRLLGRLLYYLLVERRRITRANLKLAFPALDSTAREALAREAFEQIGMATTETGAIWFFDTTRLADRISIIGGEHIDAALERGKGVILLQAHFTLIDFGSVALGPIWPIAAVYDSPKNPLFAEYLLWQRQRFLSLMINNRDIRSMVRHLKRGGIVWYSPDQTVSTRRGGVPTRFFNTPVLTTAGTARMVAMTDAVVLPLIPSRHRTNGHYTFQIDPPMTLNVDDPVAATQAINDVLEAQVRQQPGQYLWAHKRFKPPGSDVPDPYR